MTPTALWGQFSNFTTIFFGIFVEATPFLLLGAIASGLIEVFVSQEQLGRLFPRRVLPATIIGSLLGFIFPICDCGVVPLTQRLYKKGLPVSAGIAFLLAAPIVNPIVIASTYAAYGWGRVLFTRLILGVFVSSSIGLIFSLSGPATNILRRVFPVQNKLAEIQSQAIEQPIFERLQKALRIGGDEFLDMGRYLVMGCLLAAFVQTIVPPRLLLAAGSGAVSSVFIMQGLAYVLSVCSTVDAFLSLSFIRLFSVGSILGFLVFGPMVDIKTTLMFLGVLRPKMVFYLILITFLLVAFCAVFINTVLGW